MKIRILHHTFSRITLLLAAAALAACQSVPLDEKTSSQTQPPTIPVESSQSPTTTTTTTESIAPTSIMNPFNASSPLAQERSVHFAFDSYTVDEQYHRVVDMHANYLTKNPQQTIRVEGHADARGGSEYNLALGQRRSDAVANRLTLLGVRNNQIETISFGKERPRSLGSSEADFADNRRADIVYQR